MFCLALLCKLHMHYRCVDLHVPARIPDQTRTRGYWSGRVDFSRVGSGTGTTSTGTDIPGFTRKEHDFFTILEREPFDFCMFSKSHTRTVVRECCKGDDASQWENGKFDPLPPTNPSTNRHQKLRTCYYDTDIYRRAKFSRDPSRGFFSPYARNCASKCLLGFFFFFRVLPTSYSLDA